MATAAVIGVSVGKRLLTSSLDSSYSDITSSKLPHHPHHALTTHQYHTHTTKRPSLCFGAPSNINPSSEQHTRLTIKALKQNIDTSSSTTSLHKLDCPLEEEVDHSHTSFDIESSLEALLLLHKSILEKQWNLSCEPNPGNCTSKLQVIGSGISARQRRNMRKYVNCHSKIRRKYIGSTVCPELVGGRHFTSYVKRVISDELLTHAQVVHLSKKIKAGLSVENYKSKLKKRLGYEPSDAHLAYSLRTSVAELRSKRIECSLAREKLAMCNVRLVMSIAKKYDNMGAEMADLVQGGLIGLIRGIEKFDSSKGFKISTYVYWWIRQGVSRTLVENSRTLRLPTHLHERLRLIQDAKIRLEDKGITPSIEMIADCLNMSQKKVKNATEAVSKVYSLDREVFPSLDGLPGETFHSYIADNRLENNPWHGVNGCIIKDEVNNLIKTTLRAREQDIVRLYYGLDKECLTWEDISRRIGLSRERVRQVGLVALEKLKHAARRKKMDALLKEY